MNKEILRTTLVKKFAELSELFTVVKDMSSVEPEQKCAIITEMLKIYEVLTR